MTDLENIAVVIPAFNEEEGLKHFLPDLIKSLPGLFIIVVDDASTDGTKDVARANGVKVIRQPVNRGYGASLKAGSRTTDKPWVLFCDADGQHRVEDIQKIIAARDEDTDMVVGERVQGSHTQKRRRPGKMILRNFANFLAGQNIPDFNSGLRLVKRDILLKYFHLMPDGFSMSTTMTFAFLKTNRNIKWVKIKTARRVGKSSVRMIKHGSQTALLMLRLTVLFEPLKVFLTLAGIMFVMSLVNVSVNLYLTNWDSIGTATVILFLSALIIFMIGLVCDQVSALRLELHEK